MDEIGRAPIPQSKIPGFAPENVQMITQNMLSSGYVQTNPDISQAATFYSNRPICVHTKPMNPLTDTALFRNLFPEWFKPLPQEPGWKLGGFKNIRIRVDMALWKCHNINSLAFSEKNKNIWPGSEKQDYI